MLKLIAPFIIVGYILPSSYILEQMRKNLMRFDVPHTFYGKGMRSMGDKSVNFSFVLSADGEKFVMEVNYPDGREYFMNYPGGFTRVINQRVISYPSALPYIASVLNFLLFSQRYDLSKLSIDPNTVSFTRFKERGEILYSIGAKDGFLEVNQMWVLKDAFIPRRFIFVNRYGSFDVIIDEFSPTKDGFMPSTILFSDNDGRGRLSVEGYEKGFKLKPELPALKEMKEERDIDEEYKRFKEM